MIEAIAMAQAWELEHDPSVVVLGEDGGKSGGVFRATAGLIERFGPDRVQDTPLAENMISGMCVGMAAQGLRPVAEIQFMGFLYPAIDQIVNHMSRLRHRTRGRLSCPVVLRMPHGGGIHAPEHHSESVESMIAHVPGIRVVCPSSPARAYGLLLASIRDPDPVLFLEPTRIYRMVREEVTDDGHAAPLDASFVLRDGSDITFVSWGAMLQETLAAADRLAEEGVSAEVIDCATLKPLDDPLLHSPLAPIGNLAASVYNNLYWYPFVGSKRAEMMLNTAWGQKFLQYSEGLPFNPGANDTKPFTLLAAASIASLAALGIGAYLSSRRNNDFSQD